VELKVLRRMQTDLNSKIQNFWAANPGVREGTMDERQKRTIERLYHQQNRLREDLEKLVQAIFAQR
jgi:hypothetical protein